MNENFKEAVVISHRGGKGGGNAVVTAHGLNVISHFHNLENKFFEFLKSNTEKNQPFNNIITGIITNVILRYICKHIMFYFTLITLISEPKK